MKRFYRSLSLLLAMVLGVMLFSVGVAAINAENSDTRTVNEPYEYPIQAGTAEWAAFNTHRQKLDACQIPEDLLKAMTTEALLETVLNYPLLVDILAYNSEAQGIQEVSEQFNGLKELLSRNDFSSVAPQYIQPMTMDAKELEAYNDSELDELFKQMMLECLVNSEVQVVDNSYTIGYKKTPSGTLVEVQYPINDIGLVQAALINNQYDKKYPNAVRLDGATRMYNCHTYAWVGDKSCWMPDPTEYMTDGSYGEVTSVVKVGDKLYSSSKDHSAVIYQISSNVQNPLTVTSKWGQGGLYRHLLYDCPYETTNYSVWR